MAEVASEEPTLNFNCLTVCWIFSALKSNTAATTVLQPVAYPVSGVAEESDTSRFHVGALQALFA